jgi:hypothetical protein
MKPLDVLNYLCQNNLIILYPNTAAAMRILLALPVSVAGGERSFPVRIHKTLIKKFNKTNKTYKSIINIC